MQYAPLEFSSPIQREATGSSDNGLSSENLDLLTNSDMLLLPGVGVGLGFGAPSAPGLGVFIKMRVFHGNGLCGERS
jgi:hypothetical protein